MLAREFFLDRFLAGEHVLFAPLFAEPLLDLVLGAAGFDDREPVQRRPPARFVDQNLADVAVLQLVVQRHDPAVDSRAHAMIADVGVHVRRRSPAACRRPAC